MDFLSRIKAGTLTEDMTHAMMTNVYQSLALDHAASYIPVFSHLLTIDEPLLIHCSAGKDRTGVGAALVLMALGVDRDTIMADYLLTGQFYPTPVELNFLREDFGFTESDVEITMPIFSVKPDYLQAFFNSIDAQFSSEEQYLEQVYDLDETSRLALASRCLR